MGKINKELAHLLGGFINSATRMSIKSIHSCVTNKYPYSSFFQDVILLRNSKLKEFEEFIFDIYDEKNKEKLKKHLDKTYIPMINKYNQWFESHKEKTLIFGDYNPYEQMFYTMENTLSIIFEYFPELKNKKTSIAKNKYCYKHYGIAELMLGTPITMLNYEKKLIKYNIEGTKKIVDNSPSSLSRIGKITKSFKSDNLHFKDSKKAKQLLSDNNETEAYKKLEKIIIEFAERMEAEYPEKEKHHFNTTL